MSEGTPEPGAPGRAGGSGKRLFGLPRNVVIIGGVAFAGTIIYLWWRNRGNAAAANGTSAATAADSAATGTDYSGEISTLQGEIAQLQQQGAGVGAGGSSGGGGGDWGSSWQPSSTGSGSSSSNGSSSGSGAGTGDSSSGSGTSGSATSGGTTGGSAPPSTAPPAPPAGGHVISRTRNDITFGWNPGNAHSWRVTLTGPGPENGRTNTVSSPRAVYSGLQAGHTYSIRVTPLNASGTPGPSGTVTGVTLK